MLLPESRAEETAQDHDSLVVRRTRHPRLALDVDHARLPQRASLEWRQILPACQRSHARGIVRGCSAVGSYRGPHLGLHLEQIGKVGIVKIEQVVKIRAAEHYNFLANLDRLGLESAHRKKRDRLERLERHAPRLEAALERLPDSGLDYRI